MTKQSRVHSSDEFGRAPSSGDPYAGMDPPMIGAPSSIIIDGLVEEESGVTPPPPPISVRAVVITLVVMFVIGVIVLSLGLHFLRPPA